MTLLGWIAAIIAGVVGSILTLVVAFLALVWFMVRFIVKREPDRLI